MDKHAQNGSLHHIDGLKLLINNVNVHYAFQIVNKLQKH